MQVDSLCQGEHNVLEAREEAIHTKTAKAMMCGNIAAIVLCGGTSLWLTSLEQKMELVSLSMYVLESHKEAIQTRPSQV